MKYDVFISYSRRDTAVADEICRAFDKCGVTYFIDRRDIAGGMEFPAELAQAILDARVVLFLCSKDAYMSKFTVNEIMFGLNEKGNGSVIPYVIDDSRLPLFMRMKLADTMVYDIREVPIFPALTDVVRARVGKTQLSHIVSAIDFSHPEIVKLEAHKDWVLSLAFSPDGRTLASCGWDKECRLWDTGCGELRCSIDVGTQVVCRALFSPDGSTLYTVQHNGWKTVDGWIGKWDTLTGEPLMEPRMVNMAFCRNLVMNGDGSRIVASYRGVGVFDAGSLELVSRWPVGSGNVMIYGMACMDAGIDRVLIGGDALPLSEMSLVTGELIRSYKVSNRGMIEEIAGNAECSRVALVAREYVEVLNAANPEVCIRRFFYKEQDMECTTLNADGSIVAAGTKQGEMILWEAHSGRMLFHAKVSDSRVLTVAISPDSRMVACSDEAGTVSLYRFR